MLRLLRNVSVFGYNDFTKASNVRTLCIFSALAQVAYNFARALEGEISKIPKAGVKDT
jgi:hypothetical protein